MEITLEEFLIQKTNINKKFITDFFGIQKDELYKEYKPFIINIEVVAYWLDANKKDLKETLINSYQKNIDYIFEVFSVTRLKTIGKDIKNIGGRPNITILITIDAFKRLCMRSKTKNAEKIRNYYIKLEKLVDEYKDVIIANMKEKILILENDLKKETYPKGNYVYIFEEIDKLNNIYYRIGSSTNLEKRFNVHNSSSIHNKNIIIKIKTTNIQYIEKCLLVLLDDYRYKKRKDYFKTTISKINEAIKICEDCLIKFTCYKCNKKGKNIINHLNESHNNNKDILVKIK